MGSSPGSYLQVTSINFTGEGSGTLMSNVLEPLLKKSIGTLEVATIWEGGDSLSKLKVDRGVITWTDINL